ncbi:membrane-bound lytic murein transglycosylase F [Litchfieldella qijiaojingensis]|uniref:Membrane-bound lytic murein transglycosylase F n=1 Tax=Litchfieldella qijiaojingensis TaxID=980347 RepID=A0ABQ2YPU7_9GAMM|nr:membrane-bound lytic murein transglycosylase MltF [Halomonas qijiaojingensis]GGX90113.1 membrane-bound lytic murein transglycosylase F [Halomonas qijiaojingensis]
MSKAFFRHLNRYRRWYLLLLSALVLALIPNRQVPSQGRHLDDIRSRDFIAVFTRNTPTTYYEGRHGPSGFEYELIRRFADHLGVSLSMDASHNIAGVLEAVRNGEGDIGAAALPLDPTLPGLHFSRPILELQPMVVYRRGLPPLREPADLVGLNVAAIQGSGAGLILRELQAELPELSWKETPDLEVADLLQRVENGSLDAAVLYAHQFKLNRLFFPGVENGLELGEPLSMAWALPSSQGLGLLEETNRFLDRLRLDGTLDDLVQRYFGHDDYLEYVGARIFIDHVHEKLPDYADLFLRAARDTGFDWKLLAAVGYQESHWNPKATSPTGVRGLMMLTNATAGEMDIGNRLDPAQSIDGGARYLRQIMERLPEDIDDSDRLWMALAAYNVGLGHLYDARKIAEMRGGDPNAWADVREALPLLQNREWYSKTRHGYARGGEPVIYVRNIRRYYEILNYVDRSQQQFFLLNQRQPDADDDSIFNTVPPVL